MKDSDYATDAFGGVLLVLSMAVGMNVFVAVFPFFLVYLLFQGSMR